MLTLDRIGTSSALSGSNHIDIAVRPTSSPLPLSGWKVYSFDVTDDGQNGTPNHGCTSGAAVPRPNAALGDYPHIGNDANGIYITTNEYCLFGDGFNGAQIYAIPKGDLAAGGTSIRVTQFDGNSVDGSPGFTVWPAQSIPGQYSTENGGTEFFLSSITGDGSETGNPTGTARRIGLWGLSGTSTLASAAPALKLSSRLINSQDYAFPPPLNQKPGDYPLGQCLSDPAPQPALGGLSCAAGLAGTATAPEVEGPLDGSDGRMQQVSYANGVLWGGLDTAVSIGGDIRTGIAWFTVKPKVGGAGNVEGKVVNQGYVGLAGNNVAYPAINVLPGGKGVMAFTVSGDSYYPSAGYALIGADGNVGPVHVASPGVGPQDGFSEYTAFRNPPRPRWGDYGAAAIDGNSIWVASESIEQSCTYAEYLSAASGPRFSCARTRDTLGNWSTRITKVTP